MQGFMRGGLGGGEGWPWQWKIFRAFGIPVYLHLFFIIFVAGEVLHALIATGSGRITLFIFITMLILFGVVLLHEFGHSLAARTEGGHAHKIILWPLGGLALCDAPMRPKEQGIVAVGGPLVNVIIFAIFFPLARLFDGIWIWNPLAFPPMWNIWAMVAHIAYILLLFNLVPAFPLDGGQIFRALLWPRLGFAKATLVVTGIGYFFAIALVVLGFALPGTNMYLIAIGIFAGFACWQERQMLRFRDPDVDAPWRGYARWSKPGMEPVEKKPGFWERRRQHKADERKHREAEDERRIRERVDKLLEKVAREGMTALTEAEKRELRDMSKRYRSE